MAFGLRTAKVLRANPNSPCINSKISYTYVVLIHQRYSQTDRQTTCDHKTALCSIVHRAVKWLKPFKSVYKIKSELPLCKYKRLTQESDDVFEI